MSQKIKILLNRRFKNYIHQAIAFLFVFITGILPAKAWVFPEHKKITFLAIQNLSPEFQSMLSRLWKEARSGYETRLTEMPIDPQQGRKPQQLDYSIWPAIAGDHSTSPTDLLNTVLQSNWILKVADIGAQLSDNLEKAKTPSQRINSLQYSDMQLMKADNEYATRAGSNSVHFLLPRKDVSVKDIDYFNNCIKSGAELNALGAYAYFHASALYKASVYANMVHQNKESSAILMAAFADEAFALHFLEDAFASGHAAGTHGNASLQKGTHDYYNEAGLEVQTWDGKRLVVMGDANMRKEDAVFVSRIIQKSLEFLLQAAESKNQTVTVKNLSEITQPDTFNVCRNNFMPDGTYTASQFNIIFMQTLLPGLQSGKGELPRFRAELGTFFGISASLNGANVNGGFGKQQNTSGAIGGMEANLRFGLGLDGVLNQSGDGLVFLQAGWRQDGASSNTFLYSSSSSSATNSLASAIPARSAYNLRLRLPFCLIPGDLIFAAPLLLISPNTYKKMAIAAVNGGIIPWQSGIASSVGRFQFILGREVGVTFYGLRNPKDYIIITGNGLNTTLVEYRSTKIDFPLLEYRPLRTFSQDQTSSLMIQINAGVDIPAHAKTLSPVGDPVPELKNVWYAGLRVLFNWRHYF